MNWGSRGVCRHIEILSAILHLFTRDVNFGFLGKPVIGFENPVLNWLSVLLTFLKI